MPLRTLIFLAGATAVLAPRLVLSQCAAISFVESTRLTVPSSGAEFLVSGDVNGDGKPDLLTKSSTYFIQIELGDGTGHFTAGDKIDVGDAASAVLADLDGDGNLDLVTGGTNSVKVFKGMGGGHFALKRITNLTGSQLGTPIRTATSVLVADLNGDRKLDITFPLFSAANVRIQYSDATGLGVASERTLDTNGPIPTSMRPYHIVAADFDRDGELDLAVTNSNGSTVELLNQWDANSYGFTHNGSVNVGPGPFSLVKGDFNSDGLVDLAVRNGDGEIVLLKGLADASAFHPMLEKWTTVKPPITPDYLVAADFSNDGNDDILATGHSIQLLLGNGNGTFTTCALAQLNGFPSAATVADFDRDGRLDFAVVNKADNYVAVFLNRGTGVVADLSIAAVEVTQTIQDFSNSVPLVAGKRTFVRVHAKGNVQARGITARLTATGPNGGTLIPTLLPQNPSGMIDVKKNPNRGAIDDSFWFELPPEWLTLPSLVLKAEINTNQALSEGDYTNDVMTQPVTFTTGKTLKLRFVRYHHPDVEMSDDFYNRQIASGLTSLLTELPVPGIAETQTEFTDGDAISTQPGSIEIAHLTAWHDIAEPNATGTFYYAVGNFAGGVGHLGAPNDQNWFAVGNTAVASHEIGHTLGLSHVATGGECTAGDAPDPSYPYPNGQIGGPSTQPDKFFGLNPVNPEPAFANLFQVVPNTAHDKMTYCAGNWFADWSIKKMLNYILQNPNIALLEQPTFLAARSGPRSIFSFASAVNGSTETLAPPPPPPYQVGDILTVYGTIDLAQQTLTSLRVSREPMVGTIATSAPGLYSVRLVGAAGQTLAVHPFTPATISDSRNAGLIALTLPYAQGTARIAIEMGVPARTLRSINVSSSAPTVSAVTVTQLETSPRRTTITWKGTDADGDGLSYAILYSADARQTWQPIAQGIKATRFVADSATFQGTHGRATGFIRVIAHDGVLTGRGESGGFVVANKSPHVRIISPVTEATYEGNQFVMLQAVGADPEDGSFPGNSLAWKSSRDGLLGTGSLVQARSLSKGDHVITVSVTDSEGKTANASAVVHFGNRAAPLVVACTRGSGNATTLGGRSENGAPFRVSVSVVKRMINQGRGVYATDAAGHLARIKIVRRGNTDYLRTVATGRQTENLLRLPACQ